MFTKSFGFNWLAVCVAAAVSESKKAVSAMAAAVVGVGLLCSPMESAQGQSSNPAPPKVSSVTLTQDEASDYNWDSNFSISVNLNLGGSGWCVYIPGTGICTIASHALSATFHDLQDSGSFDQSSLSLTSFQASGFDAYAGGGYYMVEMYPLAHSTTSWIELWIYVRPTGSSSGDVSAWVEDDSSGSSYSVSVSVN